ncbi:MAG TPA: HAMP domain-containing sensor histidine kinase [Planctomycetota bacterium]|nr:HAMP domain-containing sensor histidine kinase [Planctomycetota bacterium]
MTFRGLAWRVGLPFLLLVLAETVTLAIYMTLQIAGEQRARLERLAAADAAFIGQASLPCTERLAEDLQRVTEFEVHFREGATITPAAADRTLAAVLATVPADGRAHRDAGFECAGSSLGGARELLLVRRVGTAFLDPLIYEVLAASWLLAILIAWLAVRGLVRPLRSLAAKLPDIESSQAITVPEAGRNDEIGDVARAFLQARRTLHDEREQRARMEKLAVLGRMTASLAHEIQNPVAAIKMHAQLLRGADADDVAGVIEHEAVRIENLLHQWMFLSRPEPPALSEWDVGELLDEVVRAQQRRLDHARVRMTVHRRGLLTMRCDGKRLTHVFSNLLANATQAMPRGGDVVVTATGDADTIEVRFADGGAGFSAQALGHFAEFFFSEKEGGMGIGLGVANEIVRAHGGSMRAENLPDGGACVTVVLPRRAPAAAEPGRAVRAGEPTSGTTT